MWARGKVIERRSPYLIAGIYFILSFLGLFRGSIPPFYLLPIPILVLLPLYRKPSLITLSFSFILTNLSVQLSGSTTSFLFFFYYLLIFLSILQFDSIVSSPFVIGLIFSEIGSHIFTHHSSGLWHLLPLGVFSIVSSYILYQEKGVRKKLESQTESYSVKEKAIELLSPKRRYTTPDRPYQEIIRLVNKVFKPHTTALFLRDKEDLVLLEGFSSTPLFQPHKRLKIGEGIIGLIAKEKRAILIGDFFQDATTLGYYTKDLPIRCFLGVPIILEEKVEGVLVMDSRERETFTEKEKEALISISHTLGLLLDSIRSYLVKEREASRLSTISDLSSDLLRVSNTGEVFKYAFKKIEKVLKPERIYFASVDESSQRGCIEYSWGEDKTETGFSFFLDEGQVGWIARNKGSFREGNLSKKELYRFSKDEPKTKNQSFLGVPVMEKKDCIIGALWVEKRESDAFTEEDENILKRIADTLGIGLTRAQLYEKIQDMADRDSLTFLYNHRKFQEILGEKIQKKRNLVLMILDIDHFKSINDEFTHPRGDRVLKEIAQVLSSFKEGIAARYGGEEFAFILPGYSKEKGIEMAERICSKVKSLLFHFEGKEVKITLSVGLSCFPLDAEKKDALIKKADNALYHAKREGRDRIVAYPLTSPEDSLYSQNV